MIAFRYSMKSLTLSPSSWICRSLEKLVRHGKKYQCLKYRNRGKVSGFFLVRSHYSQLRFNNIITRYMISKNS